MASGGPREAVFTTVLVNQEGKIADRKLHEARLKSHALRLRIELPEPNLSVQLSPQTKSWQLARISYNAILQQWDTEIRHLDFRDEAIDAITAPAPRWNERTNGCKHGDWNAYHQARKDAMKIGCDIALLVHDYCIVDADRATPMVLDEDGTVWVAGQDQGGVDGIVCSLLEDMLPRHGVPVVKGRLNERTIARCAELIVVGTGIGACRINTIDGEKIGHSTMLSALCQQLLHQHFTEAETWS